MEAHLEKLGLDPSAISERARSKSRGRASRRDADEDADMMDVDGNPANRAMSVARQNKQKAIEKAKARARSMNRREDGTGESSGARSQAEKMAKLNQKKMNRMARQGEADRHQTASIAKHLFSGKRGLGSTRSR